VELMDCTIILWLSFWGITILFFQSNTILHDWQQYTKVPILPPPCQHLSFSVLFWLPFKWCEVSKVASLAFASFLGCNWQNYIQGIQCDDLYVPHVHFKMIITIKFINTSIIKLNYHF
jgi:hypothetical protein